MHLTILYLNHTSSQRKLSFFFSFLPFIFKPSFLPLAFLDHHSTYVSLYVILVDTHLFILLNQLQFYLHGLQCNQAAHIQTIEVHLLIYASSMKVKCYSKICCITTKNSYKSGAGKGQNGILIFQMLITYFTHKKMLKNNSQKNTIL